MRPQGRALLQSLGPPDRPLHLLMDKAYEGDETRQLALDLGFRPVVPPKSNRVEPWEYDREMYRRRNEVERLFRRLKGFRLIFSRFDKLDVMFIAFINFALIVDGLRQCEQVLVRRRCDSGVADSVAAEQADDQGGHQEHAQRKSQPEEARAESNQGWTYQKAGIACSGRHGHAASWRDG